MLDLRHFDTGVSANRKNHKDNKFMTKNPQASKTIAAAAALTTKAPTDTAAGNNRATQANLTAAVLDLNPTDSPTDRCNVAYCAVIRLIKALLAALIGTGTELAAAEREMGAEFPGFVVTKTPLTTAEARR